MVPGQSEGGSTGFGTQGSVTGQSFKRPYDIPKFYLVR
jgi:hypothetical protein